MCSIQIYMAIILRISNPIYCACVCGCVCGCGCGCGWVGGWVRMNDSDIDTLCINIHVPFLLHKVV